MNINFNQKRALVTGAGRGIGRELVKRLYNAGAQVVAVSRTESTLQSLQEECPRIEIIAVDVGNWNATGKALENIGPIDLLVNNAGIYEMGMVGDMSEELYDKVMNINLKAVLNITQIVVKEMKKQGTGGSIVNVSSVGAKWAVAGLAVYQGLKAGLDQMSRVMAVELGPHKIRVNTVNPTVVNTEFGGDFINSDYAKGIMQQIPLGRFAEASDVVDTIMYLLSDKSSMIHGANIYIDGGHSTKFA